MPMLDYHKIDLTETESSFLRKINHNPHKLFIHPNLAIKDCSKLMKALGMNLALGTPCKSKGHRIRSRSDHCVICKPSVLSYEEKFSRAAFVYIAYSRSLDKVKIGSAAFDNGVLRMFLG